jgi:hypothetical protein
LVISDERGYEFRRAGVFDATYRAHFIHFMAIAKIMAPPVQDSTSRVLLNGKSPISVFQTHIFRNRRPSAFSLGLEPAAG